jgi:transposase
MIQITPQMRILVCTEPVDFRKGIDGLVRISREIFEEDPFCGALFVFCNRQRTALRVLVYDGQGFWLCHKRLSEGRFRWIGKGGGTRVASLAAVELQILLWNGDLDQLDVPGAWREIDPFSVGTQRA